ncbi:MAG: glycosyltransferase family 2 protein [Patescibacteria group bacterium]|nr:glycosyltransferase family 2 protein [Patescibacteria group bacterium]MDE1966633.1 glycosyltransferase family 2 protein [Patescibacteria group bacterium]
MISVIIPARNEEKRIAAALGAILKQDHPDYEVIVVDNGSTDQTSKIASSFPGVKVLREDHMGTMWACERGRREAKGDIIVRMDADCIPRTDWLSRGASHFADPRVTAVSGPYEYFDYSPLFQFITDVIQQDLYWLSSNVLQWLGGNGVMIGGNSFMRASAMEKIGGFDTSIVFYGDDTDIAKKMSRLGHLVFDRKLILPTSARRFMRQGIMATIKPYFLGFWGAVFNASNRPEYDGSSVETASKAVDPKDAKTAL